MRKNNSIYIKTAKQKKLMKRITSIATAAVMLSGCLPMSEIKDGCGVLSNFMHSITARAFDSETSTEISIGSFQKLIDYSNNYDSTHSNDTLIITFGDSATSGELTGFKPIGTAAEPFNGKIMIAKGMTLNLPTTMFGGITDDVQIVDTSGKATTLVLTRTRVTQDEPLFADTVVHTRTSGSAEWSIHYDRYYNPETSTTYVNNFAGFIGTMDTRANVKLTSLTFDNYGENGISNISATGDVGLVCRTMNTGATLEVDQITQTSENSSSEFSIESTSSGNVGGLVGTMNDSSKLILGADFVNIQGSNQGINASSGYAGGIVGYCNGGTIKFNNTNAYSLTQNIMGSTGAGGVAGYYSTIATDPTTENYNRYAVSTDDIGITNSCKLNGDGYCGGLFGEVNNDGDMTISGSTAVSPAHGAGAASSFGGLIGKYTATALSNSLTVSATGSNAPTRSGGSVSQFGGLIGEVAGASYVRFDGVSATTTGASATSNFGGLVGKSASGFIELTGTNTIGYSDVSTTQTFGGVVGDFANGVIYLQGSTVLSDTPAVTNAAATSGQIAGYRENGLVFAADGWTMTRSDDTQTLDDVGSWGEVVRFDDDSIKQSDVLTVNNTSGSDHYVALLPAVTSMETTTDFVKTALNIQLNNGQTAGVLRCSGSTSTTLLGSASALSLKDSTVSIELDGTGITGLTRDNGTDCVTFSGTFNGKDGKIKLATGEAYYAGNKTEGNGKIYRHAYNGLFAKTSGATIQNLNIASDSTITVKALSDMYIGNVVAQASGDLILSSVKVCNDGKTTPVDYATIDDTGSSINIGGLVGNLTNAGTVSITDCEYQGEIKGNATNSKIGGLIGSVSDSNTFGITISGSSKVGGKITAAAGNEVGGTIGVIDTSASASSGRTLSLDGLAIEGLKMNVSDTCGGFLGQNWYKTDVEFTNVKVGNGASLTSSGDTAGLVHTATGYWKVNGSGITLGSSTSGDTMSVTADSAADFGLLVNKGYAADSAIYLELAPSAFSLTKNAVTLTLDSVAVFDELVAYTGSGSNVLDNGQGIISIATPDHALLAMGGSGTGATYQHKTAFLDNHSERVNNPHSRYYYNLDAYRSNPSAGAQQLLIWSVRQYAHKSIRDNFNFTGNTITGSMNMAGYSYYPVDLTGTLVLNGAVHLYNAEFDATETSTTDNRLTTEPAQHYLMQDGLFRNVSGTLAFNGSLDGNLKKIDNYCGALVMGTVSTDASGTPATINVNSLELAGVKIGSAAGPLLINKAGSNATLNIMNVSNDSSSYASMGAGATTPSYIATSLLGDIGSADASALKLTFSLIKLDGRNIAGVTALPALNNVYHSKGSLFSNATLVNSFAYKSNSGSYGVYNYEYDKDWDDGNNNVPRIVTYGAEIDSTIENVDDLGNSKQQKYNRLSESDTAHYTRPDSDPATNSDAVYGVFGTNFQNYVGSTYTSGGTNHELRVNISTASFSGCGTYNDPYIITSGSDLENIAKLINNTFTDTSFTIRVPSAVTDSNKSATWCANKEAHTAYTTFNKSTSDESASSWSTGGDAPTTILNDTLREYLAGAYYKIDSGITGKITLSAGFEGLSNNVGGAYAFRGVIDGSGKIIVNPTTQPLIVNSYGSVVYNLELDVQPSAAKPLSMTNAKPFLETGNINSDRCEAYGAVMGQIFGGDNIIDDVSVKFTGAVINANGRSKAYLVPIGGYVGVVVNGGLIFRSMTGLAKDDQAGLTATNLTGFGTGVGSTPTDPTASDNTKWLYVNPIVGRVLNGYAVTESATYKPFEDGTRTYPDGSGVVLNGTGFTEVDDMSSFTGTSVGVTMRNGTKNYSIADISTSDTTGFNMTGIANGDDIKISTAQGLYIMSLITQSGLGKSSTGAYSQLTTLKPYDEYMATHNEATYHYVGGSGTDLTTDYAKTSSDVYAGNTDKIPYIIKKYTNTVSSVYPAFDVMGDSTHDFDLILDTDSATTFYLPDSYRGLGSLMFGVTTGIDDGYHVMYLSSLDGNGNDVSLNMNLQSYRNENYFTLKANQASFKTGFALIDCLCSSGTFSDLTIHGNVDYKKYGTEGVVVAYDSNNVGSNASPDPAVSAFVGVPVSGSGDMTFDNINVDSMAISGMCYVGGFVGAVNIEATLTFTECGADNLKIYAGGAAGGLIGYFRNNNAKVVADFATTQNGETVPGDFGIISIVSSYAVADAIAENGAPGSGGLIGYRKTGITNPASEENFTISNVIIKNGSRVTTGYIGCNRDSNNDPVNPNYIPAGGIIGNADAATILNANKVTVENLDIWGAYAGGFVGKLTNDKSKFTIRNSEVKTTENVSIKSVYNNSESACGGFVGKNDGGQDSKITDSKLTDYAISGYYNVGGLIGHNSTEAVKTLNNISVSGHTLTGTNNVGGLVGYQQSGSLNGYNILMKDQTSSSVTPGGSITNNGYIVGNNNSQAINLVGFSRQGMVDTAKMVGNSTAASDENYGSGGYVVFADYKDAASGENPNVKFSNMQSVGTNVGAEGSGRKVEKNTFKQKADGATLVGGRIDESGFANQPDEAYDADAGTGAVLSYSGKRYEYVPNAVSESQLEIVASLSDLVGDNAGRGFYLYCNSQSLFLGKNSSNVVFNGSNKWAINEVAYANAVVWHFVNVGTNEYKIYTQIGNDYYYIKTPTDKNLKTVTSSVITTIPNDACTFVVSDATVDNAAFNLNNPNTPISDPKTNFYQNTFYFKVKSINWWFSHSGGNGMRFWNQHFDTNQYSQNYGSNQNESIKIYKVPAGTKLQGAEYSSITINGSTITPVGNPTRTWDANATEQAAYVSAFGTSTDGILYDLVEYRRTNQFETADNRAPYVTTNPRFDITKSGDTALQWLTSDGVSYTSFYGSSAQAIIQGINTNKGYANTGLTDAQRTDLRTRLASNMKSIRGVVTATNAGAYNGEDFPVLMIDDMSTANDLVNSYLRLLTNTDYNFACGYSDGTTYSGTDKLIYNLDISKWKYSTSTGKFEKQSGEPSLKCRVNDAANGFYITATDVDNENWQISLIDVQFYDPSNLPSFNDNALASSGLIAYHLYVPVMVKKMLHYTVQIRPASTTSYNLDAYPTSIANVVENLGNPITMKVTYTYRRTAEYWEDAINSGENVCRNYTKILDVKAWEDKIQNGSIAVLVDPNNNADKYYTSDLSSVLTDGTVIDSGTKTYKLNLNSFEGFSVTHFNDLMTITLDENAETKNLVECDSTASDIVCVVKNGKGDGVDLPLRYKATGETGTYAVKVALKDHQNDGEYVQENYYISIFTKEDPTDTDMYHYQVQSTGTNFGDRSYPSARVGTLEAPHIFLGNIYTNSVTINETNQNQLMSSTNLNLSANLSATVGFTQNALEKQITTSIDNENVKIYQTFMVALNRLNGGTNQRGILVDPAIITPTDYKINGETPEKSYTLNYKTSPSYIELTNGCDIKDDLQNSATHSITITESVSMTYALSSLATQFPQATAGTSVNSQNSSLGTYMIGYSNISSTSNGGAASRASVNTDGTQRLCYYIEDDTSVVFSYNAVYNSLFDNDGNGNYGQLGLDGKEMDESGASFVQIKSAARYNTYEYNQKTAGNYVKITVKLSKKGEADETDPYTTALKISDYLADFEILDKNGHAFEETLDDPSTEDVDEGITVNKNSSDNIYTYIVPKDMLDTLSDDEFYIPINFKAYSGNNLTFEGKNSGETPKDMQYSNYKVHVTVGLLATRTSESVLPNSDSQDHIIYTNAKIHSEVIE